MGFVPAGQRRRFSSGDAGHFAVAPARVRNSAQCRMAWCEALGDGQADSLRPNFACGISRPPRRGRRADLERARDRLGDSDRGLSPDSDRRPEKSGGGRDSRRMARRGVGDCVQSRGSDASAVWQRARGSGGGDRARNRPVAVSRWVPRCRPNLVFPAVPKLIWWRRRVGSWDEMASEWDRLARLDLCSCCNPELFESYRRDREAAGRMMSMISREA